MSDDAVRMYSQAIARIHDADILSEALDRQSDSACIIRILGFEVLLKYAAPLSLGKVPRIGQNYFCLWQLLPVEVSSEIIQVATSHMPGHLISAK